MMNYEQALDYIHSRPRGLEAKPTLDRVRDLLGRLGDPQKRLKCVHIAGTNGKGSVAALMASVLTAAGYRTGMFTSPYLEDFRERIQIGGQMIGQTDLAKVTEVVRAAEEQRVKEGGEPVTEFEFITAMALEYFAGTRCELAVLETGLGGRFDPTNVIDAPEVAIITHIALDHLAQLGDTIPKIAWQKAGIIKEGSAVVIAPNGPEALGVLTAECEKLGIVPAVASMAMVETVNATLGGTVFRVSDGQILYTRLLGTHQIANALTAYMALGELIDRGYNISGENLDDGFFDAKWPARMEIISKAPLILLDAAHNPDGAQALADTLDDLFADKKITAVVGTMADKQWQAYLDILAPKCARLIAASASQPRSLPPEELAAYAGRFCPAEAFSSLEAAVGEALAGFEENGMVLVCGSVILAGQARTILKKSP